MTFLKLTRNALLALGMAFVLFSCNKDDGGNPQTPASKIDGPNGYEFKVTHNGTTETWKGKAIYPGTGKHGLSGANFRQVTLESSSGSGHPHFMMRFIIPQGESYSPGTFPIFDAAPSFGSDPWNGQVVRIWVGLNADFPHAAHEGETIVSDQVEGYEVFGEINFAIKDKEGATYTFEGIYWLDKWF